MENVPSLALVWLTSLITAWMCNSHFFAWYTRQNDAYDKAICHANTLRVTLWLNDWRLQIEVNWHAYKLNCPLRWLYIRRQECNVLLLQYWFLTSLSGERSQKGNSHILIFCGDSACPFGHYSICLIGTKPPTRCVFRLNNMLNI